MHLVLFVGTADSRDRPMLRRWTSAARAEQTPPDARDAPGHQRHRRIHSTRSDQTALPKRVSRGPVERSSSIAPGGERPWSIYPHLYLGNRGSGCDPQAPMSVAEPPVASFHLVEGVGVLGSYDDS